RWASPAPHPGPTQPAAPQPCVSRTPASTEVPTLDEEDRMASTSTITRRSLLGAAGLAGAAGTVATWPRLTGADIPGRGEDMLTVLLLGSAEDAVGRLASAHAFMPAHRDTLGLIQSEQATERGDFLAKVLTIEPSAFAPDVLYPATQGAQLSADRLA